MIQSFGEAVQAISDPEQLFSLLALLLMREHHEAENVADGEVDAAFLVVDAGPVHEQSPNSLPFGLLLGGLVGLPLGLELLLGLLDGNLARSPRDDVQVGDGVDDQEQVHGGDAEQINQSRNDTPEK